MYIQPLYTYESIYHRCLMCHPYNEPQSRFRWSKCYQSRFPSQYAVKSSLLYFKFKSPILDSGQWHINKLLSSPYTRSHSITSGYLFRRILSPKSAIPDQSSRPGNHDKKQSLIWDNGLKHVFILQVKWFEIVEIEQKLLLCLFKASA